MAATAIATGALAPAGIAQAAVPPGAPDAAAPVADGPIYAIAHQPQGNTYIGGAFSHVGPRGGRGLDLAGPGSTSNGIDLVKGTPGASGFPEVAGGEVKAVAPDGAGGWFIGGSFTHVAGSSHPRLAHITSTGAVDWSPSVNGEVLALAVGAQTDVSGRVLYVGGDFTAIGGQDLNYLAAFPLTGSTPASAPLSSWAPGQQSTNGGARVHALRVLPAEISVSGVLTEMSLVVAGGEFTKLGSNATPPTMNRLGAVWGVGSVAANGTDPTSGQSPATSGPSISTTGSKVKAIAVSPRVATGAAGAIRHYWAVYAAGDFTSPKNGLTAYRLELQVDTASPGSATFNGNYSNWTPKPTGAEGPVNALAMSGDGSTLYAGGTFSMLGQTAAPRANLGAVATIPEAQVPTNSCSATACPATLQSWDPNAGSTVRALARSGGSILAGGEFTQVGGQARNGIAAIGTDGALLGWNPQLAGGAVNALAAHGSSVYAGGAFSAVGAVKRANLAAIAPSGAVTGFKADTACGGSTPCSSAEVRALALSSDGSRLFAGGGFTQVDGSNLIHLAALDASSGNPIAGWAPNPDRFDSSGDPQGSGWVQALDVAGNALYVGGSFNRVGGQPRSLIAAVDGTTGDNFPWNPNAECGSLPSPCHVYAIEASCGTVYTGGSFGVIGGQVRSRLAGLAPVGDASAGQATSWNPAPQSVIQAISRKGTDVYVGGQFAVVGGKTRPRIAALDAGTGAAIEKWNPSADQHVYALGISSDGQSLYAGGQFNEIGEADRNGLAGLKAVGVGDGSGDATSWSPSPASPLAVVGAAFPGTYALAVSGDNVYAGGEFGDMLPRAQSAFGSFTAGAEPPPGQAEACANQGSSVKVNPPPPPIPEVTKTQITRKLKLRYWLSVAGLVEIDVERKKRGVELPVRRRKGDRKGATSAKRETVCKSANKRNKRKAKRIVKRRFSKKLERKSGKAKRRLVRRKLRKMKCTKLKTVKELSEQGEQGRNQVKLSPKRDSLKRGRYRVTLLALNAAGDFSAPVSKGFRVGRDGLKVSKDGGRKKRSRTEGRQK